MISFLSGQGCDSRAPGQGFPFPKDTSEGACALWFSFLWAGLTVTGTIPGFCLLGGDKSGPVWDTGGSAACRRGNVPTGSRVCFAVLRPCDP